MATTIDVDADQATSVPGVHAIGEQTGVGGAEKAVAEGHVAAAALRTRLADGAPVPEDLRHAAARWRTFAADLERLYPFDHTWAATVDDDVLACRCEETPLGAVRRAIDDGAHTARAVKGVTRCGMGLCQGNVCSPIVRSALIHAGHPAPDDLESRPLATPVPLHELARLRSHV